MSHKDSELYLLVMIYITLEVDLISLAKERLALVYPFDSDFGAIVWFLLTFARIREDNRRVMEIFHSSHGCSWQAGGPVAWHHYNCILYTTNVSINRRVCRDM